METTPALQARRHRAGQLIAELMSNRDDRDFFYRVARGRLAISKHEDAEDVLASAVASFIRSYDETGRVGEDAARCYFLAAIATSAIKLKRTAVRRPVTLYEDAAEAIGYAPGERPDTDVIEREATRAALADLPPRQRRVIVMQLLGYERAEICEALGVSDRGLRKLIGKAYARLRVTLRGEVER